MARTTINTEAENSTKLIFLTTSGLKLMRTVNQAYKNPATKTASTSAKATAATEGASHTLTLYTVADSPHGLDVVAPAPELAPEVGYLHVDGALVRRAGEDASAVRHKPR